MKAALLLLAALAIAVPTVITPALAQVDEKKLAEACKGKKAGDAVKVDGKDAKCK
jgi:prolyl-tRNA editing enzyme YbaK/EbsC (Cys-tRNA(Pro) deacylase)